MFFVFDRSLFFPDAYSMVLGNAVIVPGALKESTLEKGEAGQRNKTEGS